MLLIQSEPLIVKPKVGNDKDLWVAKNWHTGVEHPSDRIFQKSSRKDAELPWKRYLVKKETKYWF
jgi:hypothetical protein